MKTIRRTFNLLALLTVAVLVVVCSPLIALAGIFLWFRDTITRYKNGSIEVAKFYHGDTWWTDWR